MWGLSPWAATDLVIFMLTVNRGMDRHLLRRSPQARGEDVMKRRWYAWIIGGRIFRAEVAPERKTLLRASMTKTADALTTLRSQGAQQHSRGCR